jgi:hypothetical protein
MSDPGSELIRVARSFVEPVEILPLHRPPASALGSLPSVALSSGQALKILTWDLKYEILFP